MPDSTSILVVDDQESNRDLLARRLEQRGYSVMMAEGGQQALSFISKKKLDLVLLDVMMPEVSGVEVLKIIRRDHSLTELPVIMVTAKNESNDVVESLSLGANDYVTKPIDFQVLFARVEAQLACKRAEQALLELNQTLEQKVEERTLQFKEAFIRLENEIVERKKAEQAIKEREEKFKDFSEVASDWFWEADEQHHLSFVSERIRAILGVSPAQAIGKTFWALTGNNLEIEEAWQKFKSNLDAHVPVLSFRYAFADPGGKTHHMRISGKPVFNDVGLFLGYRGTGHDETTEVETRERIREAENQLVDITKNLPGVIFRRVLQLDGSVNYTFVSAGAYELIGLKEDEVINGGFILEQAIHADDLDKFKTTMNISAKELSPVNFEYRIVLDSGNQKWVHCSAYPRQLESGEISWDGLLLEVTDRKILEGQLVQAQKLESVGQLASGIAHEINTPTQYVGDNVRFLQEAFNDLHDVIVMYGSMLEAVRNNTADSALITEVDEALENADLEYLNDEVPRAISQAIEGIQRITAIVSAMKHFSHPGSGDKEAVDLNQVIENTVTVARNEWKYVARVETDFAKNLPPVPCYRDQLGQVFLNLIVNAAHAIGGATGNGSDSQGIISIVTRQVRNEVEIQFSDTGHGVPKSLIEKIFDPFFTTKEVGKGTGQGLAIARSVVVDKHGGEMNIESEPGNGATFTIRLPLSEEISTGKGN